MNTHLVSTALILTAGFGTRLRPLTDARAKPAMPVGGEPMIRRIIAWLAAQGVDEIVMNLHHRPETLTAVVGDGSDLTARVRYSWEQPTLLGSAGGPRQALPLLGVDRFFAINGDTLIDMNLRPLEAAHDASGALVTLALVPNLAFDRYGGVRVGRDGAVTGFTRRGPASEGSWHFVGVQIVAAAVFASLLAGVPRSTVGDLYDDLIRARPGAVRAFCTDAAFWDIGTPDDYLRASRAFSSSGVDIGRRTRVDPSARVHGSILWDDVQVGAGATLTDCIVGDGVRVPVGAVHTRSILLQQDGQLAVTPIGG
ncbi:MAG TPA: NDP-sugar synthase [Vicinamibacterales bacterium]|nr:NDP-sugar synthase [Vicinamibacterales bacterium]